MEDILEKDVHDTTEESLGIREKSVKWEKQFSLKKKYEQRKFWLFFIVIFLLSNCLFSLRLKALITLVWYPAVSIMLMGQAPLPSISRSVNQKNSPSDVQRGSFLSELQDITSHKVSLCYGIQENISPQGLSIWFLYWLRIKHFLACFYFLFF